MDKVTLTEATSFDAVGFELDEHYYKSSKKRLDETMRQLRFTDYLGGTKQ